MTKFDKMGVDRILFYVEWRYPMLAARKLPSIKQEEKYRDDESEAVCLEERRGDTIFSFGFSTWPCLLILVLALP